MTKYDYLFFSQFQLKSRLIDVSISSYAHRLKKSTRGLFKILVLLFFFFVVAHSLLRFFTVLHFCLAL